jgi:hypothetical protein
MEDSLQRRILHALFTLSRDTRHISARTLADAVGTTPTRAASTLIALERAGLCDASRARLTMLGLARAVRASSGAGGSQRQRSRKSVERPVQLPVRRDQPEPLAADSQQHASTPPA